MRCHARSLGSGSLPGPEAAGARPAPGALAGGVLALQRSAGNAAVGRALRQQRPARDPVRRPYAEFAMYVQTGGVGRFAPFRGGELVVGDRLEVRATVHGLSHPRLSVKANVLACYAGLALERDAWRGDTHVWRFRAVGPSQSGFPLAIALSGGVEQRFEHTIGVAWSADAGAWQQRIDDAEDILDDRFLAAKSSVLQARRFFNDAYEQHKAELEGVEGAEQIDRFLLYVLLVFSLGSFPSSAGSTLAKAAMGQARAGTALGSGVAAAAGGFAEGAVANVYYLLTHVASPPGGPPGTPTGPGITEPGEGVAAYLSRMLGRPGYTTAADPTFRTLAPLLTDPRSFANNLEGALWGEKARLDAQLAQMAAGVDSRAARSSRVRSYEDPVAWARRPNIVLDTLAKGLDADFKSYYEALWGAWVRVFYYRAVLNPFTGAGGFLPAPFPFPPTGLGGPPPRVEVRTRGGKIDAVLDTVVKRLGRSEYPNRQAFVGKYGDRERKEAEAASKNGDPPKVRR
jgi:hypothetical protein